jgi:ATP-binding cassette, subfamily C (CFTR/MRP), member 1
VHLLPHADNIIALDTEGKIAAQGTFAQLNAKDGYIHRFGLESLAEEAAQVKDGEKEEASMVDPLQRAEEEAVPKVIDDEARRLGDRTVYKYYFQQVGALNMTIFFAIMLIWIFMLKFPGTFTTHPLLSHLTW